MSFGDIGWASLGLVLLIAEIFSGAFVLCFFGIAALLIAGVKYATGIDHLASEIVAFGALGIACLLLFRKKLLRSFGHRETDVAIDLEAVITLNSTIPAHGSGKVEYQGSLWDAYNDSSRTLHSGEQARVIGTQGIKLIICPKGDL